jgi:uncharacterized membrane protein
LAGDAGALLPLLLVVRLTLAFPTILLRLVLDPAVERAVLVLVAGTVQARAALRAEARCLAKGVRRLITRLPGVALTRPKRPGRRATGELLRVTARIGCVARLIDRNACLLAVLGIAAIAVVTNTATTAEVGMPGIARLPIQDAADALGGRR